jgi:ribonuclease E
MNGVFVNVTLDDALAHADHEVERVSDTPYQAEHAWGAPPAEDLTDEEVEAEIEFEEEEEDEAFAESFDDLEANIEDEDDEEDLEVEPVRAGDGRDDEDAGARRRRGRRRRGRRGEESRGEVGPAASTHGDSESGSGRGRRRGRRGGRRSREEGQAHDAYAWSWPARLTGDNPYEWRGPSNRTVALAEAPRPAAADVGAAPPLTPVEARQEPLEAAEGPPADLTTAQIGEGPLQDAWVELPPPEDKPARTRRRRSATRGRGAAAEAEGVPETPEPETPQEMPSEEPPLEVPPPPETPAVGELALQVVEVAEAAPPAAVMELRPETAPVEPPPAPEPVFDPAEIVAPPTAPKRGWWRRGS